MEVPTGAEEAFNKQDRVETLNSEEHIQKWDRDIQSMVSLRDYAASHRNTMVVTGGYATEAHCGGSMTRPHKDMDSEMYRQEGIFNLEQEAKDIGEILQAEPTRWERRVHEKYVTRKEVKFQEVAPEKPYQERRTLELRLRDQPVPDDYVQKRVLIDSQGKSHEFSVIHINAMIARMVGFIHDKLEMTDQQRENDDRPLQPQDRGELQRLLSRLGSEDLEDCLRRITAQNQKKRSLSQEDAMQLALKQWENITNYSNPQKNSSA